MPKDKASIRGAKLKKVAAERVIELYMQGVEKISLLNPSEEKALLANALGPESEKRHEIARRNLKFAAVSSRQRATGASEDWINLLQAANNGIARAAEKFNPVHGVRFISYASFWVHQSVQKARDSRGYSKHNLDLRGRHWLLEFALEEAESDEERVALYRWFFEERTEEAVAFLEHGFVPNGISFSAKELLKMLQNSSPAVRKKIIILLGEDQQRETFKRFRI